MRAILRTYGRRRPVWTCAFLALAVLLTIRARAQEKNSPQYTVTPLPLPGANGLVTLDYFAYDKATGIFSLDDPG